MILRFFSFAFLLHSAFADLDDRNFLRRKVTTVSESEIDVANRVVLHCKEDHEDCLRKLKEFDHNTVKIIHKLKTVDAIAVSLARNDQATMKNLEDSGLFDIYSDPIRKPLWIRESIQVEENDEGGRKLWVQQTPYGINMVKAKEVWEQYGVRGEGVKVCVMDTGIDGDHDDFVSSNLSGYNGREAVTPWDADGQGHGTHVSGTIAAADNNEGVVGVAPDAEIYTVRVFRDNGYFFGSDVVAAAEACADSGAKVINMSLGGPSYDRDEKRIFDDLFDRGIISIAAAGNDGNDDYAFPASYDKVMSVAAVNSNRNHASFSQTNDKVDIAGPGVNVRSCWNNGRYSSISGTSMATPHVAGVAALLFDKFPNASPSEIWDAMISTAENPNSSGRDNKYGHGIVNAFSAMAALSGDGPVNPPVGDGNPGGECSSSEIDFQFELNTDDYGYETSWELRNVNSGSMVASEASGQYGNNQKTSIQKCLDGNSCYALTLYDTYGDGLCCGDGSQGFLVRINGEIIQSSTDFTQSLEITGIGGSQCQNNGGNGGNTRPPVGAPIGNPVPSPTSPPTPPPVPAPTPPPTEERECCFLVWCWSC